MYSPVSIAFFGLTGTAVGAAGLTGSFGGLTSLFVTAAVLAILFAVVLAARTVARRRLASVVLSPGNSSVRTASTLAESNRPLDPQASL